MEISDNITKPSKQEQKVAMGSFNALSKALERLHTDSPEIEIEETNEKIKILLKPNEIKPAFFPQEVMQCTNWV